MPSDDQEDTLPLANIVVSKSINIFGFSFYCIAIFTGFLAIIDKPFFFGGQLIGQFPYNEGLIFQIIVAGILRFFLCYILGIVVWNISEIASVYFVEGRKGVARLLSNNP